MNLLEKNLQSLINIGGADIKPTENVMNKIDISKLSAYKDVLFWQNMFTFLAVIAALALFMIIAIRIIRTKARNRNLKNISRAFSIDTEFVVVCIFVFLLFGTGLSYIMLTLAKDNLFHDLLVMLK